MFDPFKTLCFAAILAAASGCGPSLPTTVPVTGKLTFKDGTPIPNAAVTMRTIHDKSPVLAAGTTASDGSFTPGVFRPVEALGLIPGDYQAVIALPVVESSPPPGGEIHIPQKYGNFDTTDLRCSVTTDSRTIEFAIDRVAKK